MENKAEVVVNVYSLVNLWDMKISAIMTKLFELYMFFKSAILFDV